MAEHCRLNRLYTPLFSTTYTMLTPASVAIDHFVKVVLRRDVGRLHDFLSFSPFRQGKRVRTHLTLAFGQIFKAGLGSRRKVVMWEFHRHFRVN